MDRLTELEAEAKQQLENDAQHTELRLVIGRLQEFADRIKSGLHDADWLTRREILRALVKRVEGGRNPGSCGIQDRPPPF
jgi:site-specific DNA recombinase